MKKYQNILFDWDGTLAKTLDLWLAALRTVLQRRGYDFSDIEIGANYQSFGKRFEAGGHSGAHDIISEALIEADKNIPDVELYPFAAKILQNIHNLGDKLGLVTTSPHVQIDPLLKRYGFVDLFDTVVCADDTVQQKPDPEPVIKAMKILNASKQNTVIVGDSENDIKAANGAGIDSVLFYPESHNTFYDIKMLESLKPTFIIHSLNEINRIIDLS